MKKYYIAEVNDNQFNAANKAREDIEKSFEKLGYNKLKIYTNLVLSKCPKLKFINEFIYSVFKLKKGDYVYFQYPYYKNKKKVFFILDKIKKLKEIKVIAIVHDLDSLRYKENADEINREIQSLNICDYVISHNDKMTQWLKENGCTSIISNIEIFDYLLEDAEENNNERKTDIVFAGNLTRDKSGFIYKLINNKDLSYTMNLYGPNFTGEISNSKISYLGKYPPEELIKNVEGRFGLIWDGESVECCTGTTGEYTKYNNPHKLSMYIAAGLPIICWREMAISKFVEENSIGICISDLNEIASVLRNINNAQYDLMIENVMKIKSNITNGYFIESVLNNISRGQNVI